MLLGFIGMSVDSFGKQMLGWSQESKSIIGKLYLWKKMGRSRIGQREPLDSDTNLTKFVTAQEDV